MARAEAMISSFRRVMLKPGIESILGRTLRTTWNPPTDSWLKLNVVDAATDDIASKTYGFRGP